MELSNNHRETLLVEFKKALEVKSDLKRQMNSEAVKDSLSLQEHLEMLDYINNQKLQTIEKAFIDSDVDY